MKRVLIVNPFGIGDVLFTTPLIANIRERFPDAYIGYLCNSRAKDILLNNPKVDKVYIYEKDQYRKLWKNSKMMCVRKFTKLFNAIRKKRFEIAFDLSLGQEYGFFIWLMGIKTRVGYNYKRRGMFLTNKIDIDGYDKKHMVEYYLDLLRLGGVEAKQKDLEFPIGDKELAWAKEYLVESGVEDQDIVVGLVPGGGASWGKDAYRKQWLVHRFADLANRIYDKYRVKIMLMGDLGELALCNQVASLVQKNLIMACGRTSVTKYAALLKACKLLICNDSGPLHIAVSQGVKNISIFGPVDPAVYGPYPASKNSRVIRKGLVCQPCYKKFKLRKCPHADCLGAVETGEIMTVIDEFLSDEIGGA